MELITIIFFLGYLAIALEHPLRINKTATALLTGTLCWTVYVFVGGGETTHELLAHEFGHISEILFFLLGAMTIVELVDSHRGFHIITNRVTTKNAVYLMWIVCILTFFLSAVLDNLTTTIVMVTLLRKLVHIPHQRLIFIGMVIISANAGGAWSPIGDVTTTMLWIGKQVSAMNIMKTLIIPSLVCMVLPLLWLSYTMRGQTITRAKYDLAEAEKQERIKGSLLMLCVGIGGLIFVPIFKGITHLPPYVGMLLSLSIIWLVSELLHIDKSDEEKKPYSAVHALSKIDVPAVLFFLGILLAVMCLKVGGALEQASLALDRTIGNQDIIITIIGVLSAIVDNVPLVAGAQGMYSLEQFPMDHKMWEMLAFAAGTGGSLLIIGSAAGVAAMGMEKGLSFFWYIKKIAPLALIGYIGGIITYLLVYPIFAVH